MDRAKGLSIEFMGSHPEAAATVLETIAAEDAGRFLEDVPDEVGARAMGAMQPISAAAVLPHLSGVKAAAVLLAMDTHMRARFVRLLDDSLMASIMDQMPKSAARNLSRFLRYPDGSAGAWMSAEVATFDKAVPVHDCLQQLRALPDRIENLVFVVDEKKKLHGAVELADLLAAPDDAVVGALADTAVKRFSPYARLTSVVALPAWDTALSLPVVDTKGRLLGVLRFSRLREGLASMRHVGPHPNVGRVMVHVAEALMVCAAGVLHQPSAKPALSRPVPELEDRP